MMIKPKVKKNVNRWQKGNGERFRHERKAGTPSGEEKTTTFSVGGRARREKRPEDRQIL